MEEKKNPDNIFSSGQNDIESMQKNLAKLYNLSDDDKSEQALLQSRIEEQSNLIMMLKKRADEYLIRSQSLERSNDEWEKKVKLLEESYKKDEKKSRIMQHTYNQLATSYEEVRTQIEGLRSVNQGLETSKEALQKEVEELKIRLQGQHDSEQVRRSLSQMEAKNGELEKIIKTLNGKYSEKISQSDQEIKGKQAIIDSLNETIEKMKENMKTAQMVSLNSTENLRLENEFLKKEVEESSKSSAQLSLTLKKKNDDIAILNKKCKENENKYLQMKEKYDKEADNMNTNLQIKNLKTDLETEEKKRQELRQEYEAYKLHANKLLQTEKELCARLRKLYS